MLTYLCFKVKDKIIVNTIDFYNDSFLVSTYCFLNVLKYGGNHPDQSLEQIVLEALEIQAQAHPLAFRQLLRVEHRTSGTRFRQLNCSPLLV
jgi:hypothetical protein